MAENLKPNDEPRAIGEHRAKPRIKEAIVVEGRYDKDALMQAVDAVVVETGGFGVFSDGERLELIRRLARERGVVLLTDSDGAGQLIRGHLRGRISDGEIKHAYVPAVAGKERRKKVGSKEGLLGVEGMRPEVIIAALERAGATFLDDAERERAVRDEITKADYIAAGLSGSADAAARREAVCRELGLPQRISAPGLFAVLRVLVTKGELFELSEKAQK